MANELIGRLEAAMGPDRELDARIWCHLSGKKYIDHNTPYGEREGSFVQVEYTCPPKRARQVTNFPSVPHARCYTASIDAAMLLLPPHTLWASGRMEDGPFARICAPQADGGYLGGYVEVSAATVPLAICIAALNARAKDSQ